MKRKMDTIRCGGFTVLELLTVVAVIGVLLALLIPALNQVSKTAMGVKQKAQFHAIGTALEAFRNDYGDYPPSMWDPNPNDDTDGYVYGNYSASQRLAEAIVGRDGFGFHPSSEFTDDGVIMILNRRPIPFPVNVYSADTDQANWQTKEENLAARKGPYLELENANAVTLDNLYGAGNHNPLVINSFVLVDMYKITKNAATGKMTGSPILYYKANRMKTRHIFDNELMVAQYNTYNVFDSVKGIASIPFGKHPLWGNPSWFYTATQNPNFTSPARPYRAESFILHSAGPDGLYGTTDDMFNFDQDN